MGSIIPESSVMLRWLIDYSIDTSIIIGLIFVIRFFTKKLPAWWHYTLWLILLLFMMVPMEFEKPANIPAVMPASIEENLYEFIFIEQEIALPDFRKKTFLSPQEISSNQPVTNMQNQQNPQGRHVPVNGLLLAIWLASAISFGTYILIKNILFWNTIKRESLLTDEKVLKLMEECKIRMRSHSPLAIAVTDKVKSPALFGYFRPRLLLPSGSLEKLDKTELAYIFMHELGHVKRRDVAFTWLTMLLQAIHWFNPIVWFSFHIMRIDQEAACDDFVLSRIKPGQSIDYGNAILGFLEKFRRNRKVPALAGIIESKSQIKRRMSMIINYRKYSKVKMAFTSALLILISLVFFSITGFSKENQEKAEMDSPVIKEISLEDQKDSIVTQDIEVTDKKEVDSIVQKSKEVSVAVKEMVTEEKKETVRLAKVILKNTTEQDKELERDAVPGKLDEKIKKVTAITQNKADVLDNDKEINSKKIVKVQPVIKYKDDYHVIEKKEFPIETQKNLTMSNFKDLPGNREIIRFAENTQKTPEDKDIKKESEQAEVDLGLIRFNMEIRDKADKTNTVYQNKKTKIKPIRLTRKCQIALVEAQKYFEKENYSEARQVLLNYIAKNQKTEMVADQVYLMLGYLLFVDGEVEQARKVFKEGYEANPDNVDLLAYYAATLYKTGHYEEGKKVYKEGYEAYPKGGLLEAWAFNSYKSGHYRDASQLYEKLYDESEGKERDVRHLEYAAQSNIKIKNWEEAKRLYQRMIDLPGNTDERWLKNIIALCKRLDQPEEAEKYKKQLKELSKPAVEVQKTPENKAMKDGVKLTELDRSMIRFNITPQDKADNKGIVFKNNKTNSKPVRLTRECQIALVEA